MAKRTVDRQPSKKMLLSKLVRAIDHPYLKGKGGRLMNNARKGMQVNNSIWQDFFEVFPNLFC